MNHCKDCKWWITPGLCYRVVEDKGWKRCGQPIDDPFRSPSPNGMFYEDDSGCYEFLTGPEFGCVNFEAKENNND